MVKTRTNSAALYSQARCQRRCQLGFGPAVTRQGAFVQQLAGFGQRAGDCPLAARGLGGRSSSTTIRAAPPGREALADAAPACFRGRPDKRLRLGAWIQPIGRRRHGRSAQPSRAGLSKRSWRPASTRKRSKSSRPGRSGRPTCGCWTLVHWRASRVLSNGYSMHRWWLFGARRRHVAGRCGNGLEGRHRRAADRTRKWPICGSLGPFAGT